MDSIINFFKNKDNLYGILIVLFFGILFAIGFFSFDLTSLLGALITTTIGSVLAVYMKESKRTIDNDQKWYSYLIGYVLALIVAVYFWTLV